MKRLIPLVLFVMGVTSLLSAMAGEFRCDTEIFREREKQPVVTSMAIFTGPVVYDFRGVGPDEITVYDFQRGRITLLNVGQKTKTIFTTDDVLRCTAAYKTMRADTDLFKFCLEPKFTKHNSGEQWQWTSPHLSYKAKAEKATDAEIVNAYREFADWSARLNAMRPGNLPPFPRLDINNDLALAGMLPKDMERVTTVQHTGILKRTETMRSEHLYSWKLSPEDRRRVTRANEFVAQFSSLEPDEYLQLKAPQQTARR